MTAPAQPGWYDDPENPDAQRYWDGQNWTPHRQRKNTASTQPEAAPAAPPPPPPMPPPPVGGPKPWEQIRPYVDKARDDGQQFWSRQPRERKIIFAAAAALVAIAAVITFWVTVLGASGGGDSAVDTSSQSYQMGLKTGTDGQAEIAAYGGFNILTHQHERLSHQDACEGQWQIDNGAAPDLHLNHRDYMAGCLYGLDHNANSPGASHAPAATVVPPSKKGPNGATIPNRPGS